MNYEQWGQLRKWLTEPVIHHLDQRFDELGALIMAVSQADLDAVTSALADLKTTLTDDDAAIQTEIANLQAANPNLDLSGLQAAVTDLSSQVDQTTALVPAAPTA